MVSDLVMFVRGRLKEDEVDAKTVLGLIAARLLREVEAMRAITDEYEEARLNDRELPDGAHDSRDQWEVERDAAVLDALEGVMEYIAGIWRDHPAYDPGWAVRT